MRVVFGFGGDGGRTRFGRLPLETGPRSGFGSLSEAVDRLSVSFSRLLLLLLERLYPRPQSRHVLLLLLLLAL